ncbi:LacI family DNA-binding transcriptional regulator [Mesobacterium pallidum]|uniref:LacI family DNA-binding transcriptional regulator n=1 Tax=Mesobacterium pallidum TaxID=2872037 RepID=UPI001EE21348|nr:LacI family DNA-binding transcriptional regulator [Mesobacterium pallidum]
MTRKPTIADLAKAAQVGAATVDRVLNARPNVSEHARIRVTEAAVRLGYPLPAPLARLGARDRPELSLGFVLHKRNQDFYQRFAAEIETACKARSDVAIALRLRFSGSQSPDDFVKEIRALAGSCTAIAATGVNHASLTGLAQDLAQQGIALFSLLNDFAGSAGRGYVGLDNLKVGRTAGWMMATRIQRPEKVAVFVGGTRWHGQAMRETGFRSYLREYADRIEVLDTSVNLETRQLTYEATLDLLTRHPDLAGLYVAGGGMEGAIAALRETRPADKVTLIVNELTPDSRRALADRYVTMVMATPLDQLCADLVERMVGAVLGKTGGPPPRDLEPRLYLPESV